MNKSYSKLPSRANPNVNLKIIPGHFASVHSHLTHYLDFSTLKTRCSEARGVAELLSQNYVTHAPVDTIVCIDGTEVVGTYLAEDLTRVGILSYNAHKTIYVISPEYSTVGQLFFRDNLLLALRGKHVLILMGAVSTGKTVDDALQSMSYYGAEVSGVAALFSAIDEVQGIPVTAAFRAADIPGYKAYDPKDCPFCKKGQRIDALINSYGYSEL